MAVPVKWIVLGVVAIVVIGAAAGLVSTYNSLVQERQGVETQGSQVDVQYQRAFGLLPTLTGLAQQYMANERGVLENITALQSGLLRARNGTLSDKDAFLSQSQQFVLFLQARQGAYPDLKASRLFQDTMTETINTANKVATEKGRYNEVAGVYNAHIQECCFPAFVAGTFGFHKAELIQYSDRPNQTSFPTDQRPIA